MSVSNTLTLDIQERSLSTRGVLNLLRREGRIPGIVYGQKKEPQTVSLCFKEIKKVMELSGFRTRVYQTPYGALMIKHMEFPPIKDTPMHIDLIRLGEKVDLNIPLTFVNREGSPGIKKGGLLNTVHSSVRIRVLTENIPNSIEIDLKGLEIGQSVKMKDLILPEGVVLLHSALEETLITIVAPTVGPAETKK